MVQPTASTYGTRSMCTPRTDELFQLLKEHDTDWLNRTLYDRWLELAHEQPARDAIYSVSTRPPIWPFDVTIPRLPPQLLVSDYVKLIRAYDWGSTQLGPMSDWSLDLRRMANMCLCDTRAGALWIGPTHASFYNEAYSVIAGQKHPQFLGRPFVEMWPEPDAAAEFLRCLDQAKSLGISSSGDYVLFTLERHGFLEEMWASWSLLPLPDSNGGVFGCYNVVIDVTKEQVSERRLSTLLQLGQTTGCAVTTKEVWQQTITTCKANAHDIPFAVAYSMLPSKEAEGIGYPDIAVPDRSDSRQWHLEGSVGLPEAFNGFPETLNIEDACEIILPSFQAALARKQPVLLSETDGTFPQILQGTAKSAVNGVACKAAVLLPVCPTNREQFLGFILVGVNPLSVYDADYERFAHLLMQQCATSMASIILMDEEVRESRLAAEAAERDRLQLSKQLIESQTKVVENETRFRNMADMAPVAMFHLDEDGKVLYANELWLQLTQHSRTEFGPKSWLKFIYPDDRDLADREFTKLTHGEPVNFEVRWIRPFAPHLVEQVGGEQVGGSTWTIASAYAEKRADGSVKGILGCLTDISRQKWNESFQKRQKEDALELKRQQENFMDMISHETRNPLSAIMLSVESISDGLDELSKLPHDPVNITQDTVSSYLESTEIIMTCAQHQKRIVDDVLTLSKLDSGLLTICPVETRPVDTIARALKMFDAEVQKHDITLDFRVEPDYGHLKVDWVKLDPSRLLQVLINLMTNAIKFTLSEAKREIAVTLTASKDRPTASLHGCEYVQNEWTATPVGRPDQVFLSIEVIDTGRGITAEEMKKLFGKFQQASPKTHVEYGGSGLGLFISKQLSHMQGGAIGVKSSNTGATFAFYILVSRCLAPAVQTVRKDTSARSATREGSKATHTAATRSGKNPRLEDNTNSVPQGQDKPTRRQINLLLVEDNVVNQKVMRTMLQRANYKVHVANHGLEALEYISSTALSTPDGPPLDVVLMDVEMPVCNGLECARRIRQMQQSGQLNAHLPIVGVTANARSEQQMAAIEAGMDAVVTKPFRLSELSVELDKITERSD